MSRHVRLLGHAAKTVDSRSARSRQRKVGASEIGVCRRRAGYSHHNHPVSDPDNVTGLPAVAGTWFHKGALDTMRREWGTLIETTVEDEILRGHVDGIDLPNEWRVMAGLHEIPDAPDVVEVDDLKTKRDARMVAYVRNVGPKRSELYQVHLYGDLLRRGRIGPFGTGRWKKTERALSEAVKGAGGPGLPVERIRLRYMPRTGEEDVEYVHEQPFDEDVAAEAWEWVKQVSASTSPDDLPRDQDGPGLSTVCDHCPFLTACWGQSGDVAPQAQLIVTDTDLAATLQEYDAARAEESAAKARKDLARKKLDGTDPAIYTDGVDLAFKVGWTGGRAGDAKPDVDAMVKLFEDAGLKVPYLEPKTSPRSIGITRWDLPYEACGKPVGDPVPVYDAAKGLVLVQDRPRGGWSVYQGDAVTCSDQAIDTITAGGFAREHPAYVDPRTTCVLKAGHASKTSPCMDDTVVHELDLDDDLEPAPDAPDDRELR